MTENERFQDYLKMLRVPFQKLCRLRFLQPDGTTAFSLDNNPRGVRSTAFISDGTISGEWQTGRRRNATVTISNVDGQFDYNVNQVWFGTEIALDEGVLMGGGKEIPLCELEVEFKAGSESAALLWTKALAAKFRLQKESRSKFRRASLLAKGEYYG